MFFSVVSLAMDARDAMQDLIWKHRVLLVFTPNSEHKKYKRQNTMLAGVTEGLLERDMVIIRVMADGKLLFNDEPQPQSVTGFYQLYNVEPSDFRVVMVGKDGTIKLDRANPVSSDALFALIDAMPMRQYEMLEHGDETDQFIR